MALRYNFKKSTFREQVAVDPGSGGAAADCNYFETLRTSLTAIDPKGLLERVNKGVDPVQTCKAISDAREKIQKVLHCNAANISECDSETQRLSTSYLNKQCPDSTSGFTFPVLIGFVGNLLVAMDSKKKACNFNRNP